jgi:nucleotide-binding universal stress UspA family protein
LTLPVDGSPTADRGAAFAFELAGARGRVSICSVVDPSLLCVPPIEGGAYDPAPMLDALEADAALFCARAATAAALVGTPVDTTILRGPCADAITTFAARNGSDAIVIGTHGRTGLARAVIGSIAEAVIRRSAIPVVAVHVDDVLRTGPVAVALDASPAAQAALECAIAVAEDRGLSLMIVAVVNPLPHPPPLDALLERAAERARERGIATRLVVREEGAAEQILEAAEEHDCCMIVMGTHGRSAVSRFFLGSVAATVVERAHVPVVTVRDVRVAAGTVSSLPMRKGIR